MTLCIAAHAHAVGPPRIVLCSDKAVGDEYGISEVAFKCDLEFGHGLAALWAGTTDQIEDVVPILRRSIDGRPTLADYKEKLWEGMNESRAALKRRGVENTDVEVAVAGFIENKPRIVYVTQHGVVAEPFYRAIGSGWQFADSMLRWRHMTNQCFLNDALYFIYEAKRFGETSPFVGERTTMFVIEPREDSSFIVHTVGRKGVAFLESRFCQFGPQDYPFDNQFPGDGFA